MKKSLPLAAASLMVAAQLFSQAKGAATISNPSSPAPCQTRAVVVGISDYQDPGIPNLRFADRDAEAFANFLRSQAGGSLDSDHLKVLTNSAATTAQFDAALGWLIDESRAGDEAIIYFSGHGDVETKTRSQQGFLLFWDSPPQAYVSGAYPIFFLKEVVSTLSLENKCRVVVVTDACRAGKLAGSGIGGAQLTSQNLAQQFANEIKILSCQPNEQSLEGEQWGGGRGAFSFHLVDGLCGLADGNGDQAVTLSEIGRYLEDHVSTEVAPHSQVPMVIGNRGEKLAKVFPDQLAAVRKSRTGQPLVFSPADNRGIEEEVLAAVDSSIRKRYLLFKKALKEKHFFDDATSADALYAGLAAEPRLARLHPSMRRNYAAALQDDAQQAVNNLMKMERTETRLYRAERVKKYAPYPRMLDRAAELLGPAHYMYPTLQARRSYFEAWVLQMESPLNPDSALARRILGKYRESLKWEPGAALTHLAMGAAFSGVALNRDSVVHCLKKAIELAPNWTFAYRIMAGRLTDYDRFEEARPYLEAALAIDSTQAANWSAFGGCLLLSGKRDECEAYLLKAIQLDSTYEDPLNRLGSLYFDRGNSKKSIEYFSRAIRADKPSENNYLYLGSIYFNIGDYGNAEKYFKQGLKIEPNDTRISITLANTYFKTGRLDEGRSLVARALAYDSVRSGTLNMLGETYADNGLFEESERTYKKLTSLYPRNQWVWYGLGRTYLKWGKLSLAEETLLKALGIEGGRDRLFIAMLLGQVYTQSGRFEEARRLLDELAVTDAGHPEVFVRLALLAAAEGKPEGALRFAELAFQKGMRYEAIYRDPEFDFAPVRALPGFEELMKRHFPEKAKD